MDWLGGGGGGGGATNKKYRATNIKIYVHDCK